MTVPVSASGGPISDERPWGDGERIKNAILAAGNNRTVSVDDAWGALGDLRDLLSELSRLRAVLTQHEEMRRVAREAFEQIVHTATDLPHARRLDRDEMRSIAFDGLEEMGAGAIAALEGTQE